MYNLSKLCKQCKKETISGLYFFKHLQRQRTNPIESWALAPTSQSNADVIENRYMLLPSILGHCDVVYFETMNYRMIHTFEYN